MFQITKDEGVEIRR